MKTLFLAAALFSAFFLSATPVPLRNTQYLIHSRDQGTLTRTEDVNILPGRKYHISCKVTNINPIFGNAQGVLVALDNKGERITSSLFQFYPWNRQGHSERSFFHTFYTPENAAKLRIYFQCGRPNHILKVRDLSLRLLPLPADGDREKDRLLSEWYKPLAKIENAVFTATPHKRWLKPAAFTMPEILYLPYIEGNYCDTGRRRMQECAQRMTVKATYLPLLGKIKEIGGSRIMGIYGSIMDKGIEKYSLKKLPRSVPGCTVVQDLDFKKRSAPELEAFLDKAVRESKGLVFVDCANIPARFLGEKIPGGIEKELRFLPVRRKVSSSDLAKFAALYRRGKSFSLVFNFASRTLPFDPLIPPEVKRYREFARSGWDIPWFDYTELMFCRLLRKTAGVIPPAAVTEVSEKNGKISIEVKGEKGVLELTFLDRFNEKAASQNIPVPGKIEVLRKNVPPCAATMEYRVRNSKGYADAGALTLAPAASKVKLSLPSTTEFGKKMTGTAENPVTFHRAEATVEKGDGSIVFKKTFKAGEKIRFAFTPEEPEVCLHLAAVRFFDKQGKLIDSAKKEFTVFNRPVDTEKLHALVWTRLQDNVKYPVYKKLGFEKFITYQNNFDGLRALRMIGAEPVIMNNCIIAWGDDWIAYKSDRKGPQIRKTCFSKKENRKKAEDTIKKLLLPGTPGRYYDTMFQFYGDEKFLGRDCCFSQWCMADFHKEFPGAEKADCMPGKKHHLDHRIFMNKVFADNFAGALFNDHKKVFPNHFGGLSGTYHPGSSYNWAMLMKHFNFVAFYSGIQRKMVMDFGSGKTITGRWKGYTPPIDKDFYVSAWFWADFINGANLVPLYAARSELSGFLEPMPPLKTLSALMAEVRSGMDKLYLSAAEKPQIILFFNQRSVFLNTDEPRYSPFQTTLSGWDALLRDMAVSYRIVDSAAFTGEEKAKLLILPGGSVLSDADWAKVRRFMSRGGKVCSDTLPGEYDDKSQKRTGEALKKLLTDCSVWNATVKNYEAVSLGGTGGEHAEVHEGELAEQKKLRDLLKKELARAGMKPFAAARKADGSEIFPELKMRYRNGIRLLGVADRRTGYAYDDSVQKMAAAPGEAVKILLAEPGYVYDLRKRRALGFQKEISVSLTPGAGGIWAIHKAPPASVRCTVKKKFKGGEKVTFNLTTSSKSERLFFYEATSPCGKKYSGYFSLAGTKGSGSFKLPFNAPCGKWSARVLDCASDLQKVFAFEVTR